MSAAIGEVAANKAKEGDVTGNGMPEGTTSNSAKAQVSNLKQYYDHLFPVGLFNQWLRYGRDDVFKRREISFTLPGELYIRWKSFDSQEEFKTDLVKSVPLKIDIGAVYNRPPKDKATGITNKLVPKSKELVFDIDMTDYADVLGTMGGGDAAEECDRCWEVMATAATIIDKALREDFGFRHILWVYSGRRGVHCWVADERARKLTNEQRSAVADFLYVRFEDRENVGRKQSAITVPMHPSLYRALELCMEPFQKFSLEEAGILSSDEAITHTLGFLPSPMARVDIAEKLRKMTTAGGAAKWERMDKEIKRLGRSEPALKKAPEHLVLRHMYPRLDVNVSREINHLLKAPFSVHPKTGRVCVPFLASEAYSFQPQVDAPVLPELLTEYNKSKSGGKGPYRVLERYRTAEKVFKEFVEGVDVNAVVSNRAAKLERIDMNAAAELMTH